MLFFVCFNFIYGFSRAEVKCKWTKIKVSINEAVYIFLSSNPVKYPILQSAFSCPALLLHNLDICSSKFSLLSTSRPITFSEEFMIFLSIVSFWGLFFLVLPVNYYWLKRFRVNNLGVISKPLRCYVSFFL